MSETTELLDSLPQVGAVTWIGLSPHTRGPLQSVTSVEVCEGTGLEGDHHSKRNPGGKRQVTLIQAEHLPVVAALLGKEAVAPEELRRNIVVRGINLQALRLRQFRIGTTVLEGTGDCVPCSLMEQNLGPGGFNALRGHGGITARVISGGQIRVDDPVQLVPEASTTPSAESA